MRIALVQQPAGDDRDGNRRRGLAALDEAEMRVAAFQNGYFVALCNRVGSEELLEFSGESFVCAPDGRVAARAPLGESCILCADLDLGDVERSHARRLFMADRRPELYGGWLGPGNVRR